MYNLSRFAERLNDLISDAGLNGNQLSKAIGVSPSTISDWRNDKMQINLPKLILLADYFKCSIDFLVGRSELIESVTPKDLPPFCQRLREVLKERGYNRYSLDKQTKFKDSYIYSWDHGSVPHINSLIELADLLDCSIDYLIGREN